MDSRTTRVSHRRRDYPARMLCMMMLVTLAAAATTEAQTSTGGIRGIVSDATGATLAGVTVEASSPSRIGGAAMEVTTEQGLYHFENLPIGEYVVTFALQGFPSVRREGIRVEVGRTVEMPATLAIGNVNESVTVQAASPVVDTLHSTVKSSF